MLTRCLVVPQPDLDRHSEDLFVRVLVKASDALVTGYWEVALMALRGGEPRPSAPGGSWHLGCLAGTSEHHGSLVYRVTGGGGFGGFGCLDRYQRVMISRTANAITAPKSTDRNAVTTTSFSAMH